MIAETVTIDSSVFWLLAIILMFLLCVYVARRL